MKRILEFIIFLFLIIGIYLTLPENSYTPIINHNENTQLKVNKEEISKHVQE